MLSYLVICIVCLSLGTFFSGIEVALASANKLRLELDRKQGGNFSRIISIFLDNPIRFSATMLIGNLITLIVFCTFLVFYFKTFSYNLISNLSVKLLIQIIISTLIFLIAAEILPNLFFRNRANTSLKFFAIPAFLFYVLFYPITSVIKIISEKISKEQKPGSESLLVVKDSFDKIDLMSIINQSNLNEEDNEAQVDEIKLFQNALGFSSVKVRDCMVPRTEMVALEENTPHSDIRKTFIESGYSKIIIYKTNIDNIIGYITSKSLFEPTKSKKLPIIDVSFIPEAMSANKLLKKLIHDKKSLAVVVDEFGGVSGMITIEDIIEEIFGEIEDEHDHSEFIEKVVSENEFVFSGRLETDYLNETYNLKIPESEEYETLAGYIIYNHESIPKLNERIIIDQFEIKILKVSRTKIELVLLKVI